MLLKLFLTFIHVVVMWLSGVTATKPKFLERIPNVNVTAGRGVSLPCVVENIGDYKVAWTHIDRHLLLTIDEETVTLIPRFWVTRDDVRTWTLHIRDVQPEDYGYYVCQVNMEPMINQVGFLQVVVPPSFIDEESSPSHVSVHEGSDVVLICKAKGVPPPSISWTKEDGTKIVNSRGVFNQPHVGEELQLRTIDRQDMGAYLCIASNKVPPSISKRIVLEVQFSPSISVPNQLVGSPQGTSVVLECLVSAFPSAVHYWQFQGKLLINSTHQETREVTKDYKTTLTLVLNDLRPKDFGSYVCGAKNSLGEADSSLKLYEIPSQRVNKDGNKPGNTDHSSHTKTIPPWNDHRVDSVTLSYQEEAIDEFSDSKHISFFDKTTKANQDQKRSRIFSNRNASACLKLSIINIILIFINIL